MFKERTPTPHPPHTIFRSMLMKICKINQNIITDDVSTLHPPPPLSMDYDFEDWRYFDIFGWSLPTPHGVRICRRVNFLCV